MSLHSSETIYRKLRMNANVLPPEILILIKDLDTRITSLEERLNSEQFTTEKPKPNRRKSSKVSQGEIPSDGLPTGTE